MGRNFKRSGEPRLGRPPGPYQNRGGRPWDAFDFKAIRYVAANPDMERYRIALFLDMSPSKLSTITCSPRGVAALKALQQDPAEDLAAYRIQMGRGYAES